MNLFKFAMYDSGQSNNILSGQSGMRAITLDIEFGMLTLFGVGRLMPIILTVTRLARHPDLIKNTTKF